MGHGGRFAYWIAMAFSGLWLLIALAGSVGLLFALVRGVERFGERSITELVIGAILFLQPLLIGGLIARAYRMRMIGSTVSVIGRATLPMLTMVLLAAAVAANIYNETLIREKLERQRLTGTITYDCLQGSKTVNFDPEKMGAIDLHLTSIRRKRQPQLWLVTWPKQSPVAAINFDFKTGSIGGSQGLSWSDTNGTRMTAILSFNDILGPYGIQTIWATVIEGDWLEIQKKVDTLEGASFTCEANPRTYRPA